MKKNNFIYLAGIIDGEGSFIISKSDRGNYDNYYGRIHVKNTDKRLMKWLVEKFGGTVNVHKPKSEKHAIAYSWYFGGNAKAKELLLLSLMPYLIIKREQAKVLIEFFRMSGEKNPHGREKLYQYMKTLNKRGPTVETDMQIIEQDSMKIQPELIGDNESDLMGTLES